TSPAILTATASAGAINGSFRVLVSQLATATRLASSGPIGRAIDRAATLANAGFRITPVTTVNDNPASFSINGSSVSVDATTTLDDGTASSLISKINAAGAGVTASLVTDADGRASNRVQLVSSAGQAIQVGSLGDTSNLLRVLGLTDATVQGYTAATVTSGGVAAGALNTSITVNGVTTSIVQNNAGFSAAQNAAFIASAVNGTQNSAVQATDNGDGTFTLTQKTLGSQASVSVTSAGVGTGLTAGTTQNGTDRLLGVTSLGVADTGSQLSSSRLATAIAGLDVNGNGSLTINGVNISYRASDSISAVINRINASNAGVSAFYDVVQDRVRLAASQTGGRTITLSDTTGNFLAATGLVGGAQTLGQNAVFSIDTVNGGQTLTSSSNTLTGYVPGVTLDLKSSSATPVTVTVSQDTAASASQLQSFVDQFNRLLDVVDNETRYDATKKQASVLTGDTTILQIQQSLRSMTSDAALGVSGTYRSLADIGIGTGPTGSAVGSTTRLVLDQTKLNKALSENPQAVQSLMSGFLADLATPAGVGNITLATGTPLSQHENGTYHVNVLDVSGNAEVTFVTTDGRQLLKSTGKLTAGQDNTSLIPGVTLHVGSTLAIGEDTFSMNVTTRGVATRLNDYLDNLLSPDGFFATREDSSQAISQELTKRIDEMNARLDDKQAALTRKFAALESTLAQLQGQSNALMAQLARLSSNQ
ncbi:MAG: flagellar filament capping protein FliD, partial [Chloroflexi bacterium]|nr:flagellar filament capping protein FliD [Chloroflexota bacterium]